MKRKRKTYKIENKSYCVRWIKVNLIQKSRSFDPDKVSFQERKTVEHSR